MGDWVPKQPPQINSLIEKVNLVRLNYIGGRDVMRNYPALICMLINIFKVCCNKHQFIKLITLVD